MEQIGQTKSLPRPAVSALIERACLLEIFAETVQVLQNCRRPSLVAPLPACPMPYDIP